MKDKLFQEAEENNGKIGDRNNSQVKNIATNGGLNILYMYFFFIDQVSNELNESSHKNSCLHWMKYNLMKKQTNYARAINYKGN